ncbi:MAG: hypothetical protein ABSE40_10660 [Candidatus Sulfotelmatobacter sp.]
MSGPLEEFGHGVPKFGADAVAVTSPLAQVPLLKVERAVRTYYPALRQSVKCSLSVFGAMAIAGRTKPLSVIFEAPSGYGKTAVVQMFFPLPDGQLERLAYRSDKFTPKSFVSHAANVPKEKLSDLDMLPRVENKVLVTKDLAPIFRGRTEELTDNFSILISVLDGKGFTSDSGMRGRRGYPRPILFNWIGATTPLPPETHRLMSQLGTRLLFYEVPAVAPSESELLAYAQHEEAGPAEVACQMAVNEFLLQFFGLHPVASVPPESVVIPGHLLEELVRWAKFVAQGRREIRYEKSGSWEPIAALQPEGAHKLINYFKDLARGHALIHNRKQVNQVDLELIAHVAISSIPGHLRPIVRELRLAEDVDTNCCMMRCCVSDTSARRYMKELELLGIAQLAHGSPKTNEPNRITLAKSFQWLKSNPGNLSGVCGLEGEAKK